MHPMREAKSTAAILFEHVEPKGKTVVEIGCGTGELARELTVRGARVIAIDREAMLAVATAARRAGNEQYVAATGESLPIRAGSADLVVYIASLHHLPAGRLDDAMAECRRVLKRGGRAVFLEPVYRRGSYTDLTRLVEDEREVQELAYRAILRASSADLEMVVEEPFFIARSFADYKTLIATFVEEEAKRAEVLERAKAITVRRAARPPILPANASTAPLSTSPVGGRSIPASRCCSISGPNGARCAARPQVRSRPSARIGR